MSEIECPKCSKIFRDSWKMRRHLNRKLPCSLSDLNEINLAEIINDKNFIIPLLVIFLIFIIYKTINKKIN